jgi:Ca2+/Na+ antiporter
MRNLNPPSTAERIGNVLGVIAFIVLAIAPLVALIAVSFFDHSTTGDSLMNIAQYLLFTGLTLAMIRGAYDMCYVSL